MADIFVSYASEDRNKVSKLVEAFEQQGWSVWWDRHIPHGQNYHQVIEQSLAVAKCVVVVWSRNSIESEWVLNEASEARKRRIIIPLLFDNVNVPLEFRHLQTADLLTWKGRLPDSGIDQLLHSIGAVLGRSSADVSKIKSRPIPGANIREIKESAAGFGKGITTAGSIISYVIGIGSIVEGASYGNIIVFGLGLVFLFVGYYLWRQR